MQLDSGKRNVEDSGKRHNMVPRAWPLGMSERSVCPDVSVAGEWRRQGQMLEDF